MSLSTANFEYGIVAVTVDASQTHWMGSLEKTLDQLKLYEEKTKLFLAIQRREEGTNGDGKLFMTYPFNFTIVCTSEALKAQVKRIQDLPLTATKEEFLQKLNEIRSAFFSQIESLPKAKL